MTDDTFSALVDQDERVSWGQASERAVCVCVAVSVEKGARRPPLPAAVVCPPGGRRRWRLAITAEGPDVGLPLDDNLILLVKRQMAKP